MEQSGRGCTLCVVSSVLIMFLLCPLLLPTLRCLFCSHIITEQGLCLAFPFLSLCAALHCACIALFVANLCLCFDSMHTQIDLFIEKLKTTSVKVCFPEYDGASSLEESSDFIERQFLSRSEDYASKDAKKRLIFPYVPPPPPPFLSPSPSPHPSSHSHSFLCMRAAVYLCN